MQGAALSRGFAHTVSCAETRKSPVGDRLSVLSKVQDTENGDSKTRIEWKCHCAFESEQ